ncbi:beta-lactamase-like protein [Shewanella sediminis HAW-EB3]|uniref:Beta-lactamase-like protein n=1 Tax=Shewanella sediminis (strain HAW-EB3) TaxID=425104 RepID=A8FZV4_SHESH|nr:MBL fold metallo-hydrolase [Shewanella sediminis]ABV38377.1 beta-lactamase-like protein [Shewanella sediminis HAW-EB3]
MSMIFHRIRTERGCQSYLIGCSETNSAIIIDPEISQMEHYLGLASHDGLAIHYLLDTHTHADHFSASKQLASQLKVPVIMHCNSPAPFVDMYVDDGEIIIVGKLRLTIMHTPGHTADSICIVMKDRVFTGDTLLLGGTGRTDLPSGDPERLYDSLFNGLLKLSADLKVYPAHAYSERTHSSIGEELSNNPRLQKKDRDEFVAQMRAIDLKMPTQLTESLRTNLSGGKTVEQFISDAERKISFVSLEQVLRYSQSIAPKFVIVDVRERDAFDKGHIAGAIHIPRGQLELRVNELLPDPTRRIAVYCEFGIISVLATSTLREMGFLRAVALDHGLNLWRELGYPLIESKNEEGNEQ